jgi:hypothetical protein
MMLVVLRGSTENVLCWCVSSGYLGRLHRGRSGCVGRQVHQRLALDLMITGESLLAYGPSEGSRAPRYLRIVTPIRILRHGNDRCSRRWVRDIHSSEVSIHYGQIVVQGLPLLVWGATPSLSC